jgi:hypothetical protein
MLRRKKLKDKIPQRKIKGPEIPFFEPLKIKYLKLKITPRRLGKYYAVGF